ncbi:predicted protein [Nematostella vectensis]|uniref:G-protein coupled receptors family 1 profile domain-containing protein n=1 Tax=Nematostella vectensis TaxID=45351 RepID=A7RF33_NEMVE|nr:QRFP-like peptide receptor [Nematostella vectensis]XP_032223585.1 QRFP-like peptide receptor [Nematostella vectensis]XP_032223586.1 QRFP-like peptide receptor [Nematostella vectensis]EDO50023.1 predicted protein [Nematostella vectensis]|eukprot:XP_001642086.1 predicted protein [Nematostella vectensis]
MYNSTQNPCPTHPDLSKAARSGLAFGFILSMLISFPGNILVIVTVVTNRRMRTVTNYLIVNMAVADLLLTVFNMPSTTSTVISPSYFWYTGEFWIAMCKLLPFIQSVSVASSVLNMTAIAVDRFFAVVLPLRRYITFNVAYIMMAAVWVVAIGVSAPFLYAQNVISFPGMPGKVACMETWKHPIEQLMEISEPKDFTVVLFVVFYVLPLIVMSVLYSVVIYKLWIRKLPGQRSELNQQRADRSKKKVLRMLLIVLLLFALCWLPVHVTSFILFFGTCSPPPILTWIGYLLSQGNSAINPCIYVIFNESYRQGFARLVCCLCRRKGSRMVRPGVTVIGMDNTYIDGVTRSNIASPSPRMLRDTYT